MNCRNICKRITSDDCTKLDKPFFVFVIAWKRFVSKKVKKNFIYTKEGKIYKRGPPGRTVKYNNS